MQINVHVSINCSSPILEKNYMPIFFYWSVAQLSWTFCDPMDCSTPGFSVFHYLPEFTQIHVHWVNDAIQLSHLLSLTSPPAFNPSQCHALFQWDGSSHHMAEVLELQLRHQYLNTEGLFPLGLTGLNLQSKGRSRVFSSTTVQKHQFFRAQLSLEANSHVHTWLLEKL